MTCACTMENAFCVDVNGGICDPLKYNSNTAAPTSQELVVIATNEVHIAFKETF